jgi:hypothetical protein
MVPVPSNCGLAIKNKLAKETGFGVLNLIWALWGKQAIMHKPFVQATR